MLRRWWGAGGVSLSPGTGNASRPSPLFPGPMEAWFSTFWYVLGWVVWTRSPDRDGVKDRGPGPRRRKGPGCGGEHCPLPNLGTGLASDPGREGEAGPEGKVNLEPGCEVGGHGAVPSPLQGQGEACCLPGSLRGAGGHPCSVNEPRLGLRG